MKLYFDHICGQQKNTDFIHTLVSATFEPDEYDKALNDGWSPSDIWYNNDTNFKKNNEIIWYQSRQTRINLSKYEENRSERKARKKAKIYEAEAKISTEPDFNKLYSIYLKYVKYRGFKDTLSRNEFIKTYVNGNNHYILYGDCAFSVVEIVGKSLICHQFCWDYEEPSIGLGKYSTYAEIDFAISKNLENVYLGPSYESCSIYKSTYSGFEFWTGRIWSDNVELYENSLRNDEKLNSVKDIVDNYDNYFESFSV